MHTNVLQRGYSQQSVPEIFRLPFLKSLDMYEVTVEDLQNHMSQGKVTSLDYVTYCLERVRKVRTPSLIV